MSSRRTLVLAALFALSGALLADPPAKKPTPALPGSAPYDAAPAAAHAIEITFNGKAAQEILSSLARPKYEPTDMKLLEDMPAVQLTIRDSQRDTAVFEKDFAAAFEEKTRAAVFDFKAIRESREKWQGLLSALAQREKDVVQLASKRAAALLPGDRVVSARLDVYLTFGLASLGDHFVASDAGGRETMVLDLSRALADAEGDSLDGQISRDWSPGRRSASHGRTTSARATRGSTRTRSWERWTCS